MGQLGEQSLPCLNLLLFLYSRTSPRRLGLVQGSEVGNEKQSKITSLVSQGLGFSGSGFLRVCIFQGFKRAHFELFFSRIE